MASSSHPKILFSKKSEKKNQHKIQTIKMKSGSSNSMMSVQKSTNFTRSMSVQKNSQNLRNKQ